MYLKLAAYYAWINPVIIPTILSTLAVLLKTKFAPLKVSASVKHQDNQVPYIHKNGIVKLFVIL